MKFYDGDVYTATFADGYCWRYERNNGTWQGTSNGVASCLVFDVDIERSITAMLNKDSGYVNQVYEYESFTLTRKGSTK